MVELKHPDTALKEVREAERLTRQSRDTILELWGVDTKMYNKCRFLDSLPGRILDMRPILPNQQVFSNEITSMMQSADLLRSYADVVCDPIKASVELIATTSDRVQVQQITWEFFPDEIERVSGSSIVRPPPPPPSASPPPAQINPQSGTTTVTIFPPNPLGGPVPRKTLQDQPRTSIADIKKAMGYTPPSVSSKTTQPPLFGAFDEFLKTLK